MNKDCSTEIRVLEELLINCTRLRSLSNSLTQKIEDTSNGCTNISALNTIIDSTITSCFKTAHELLDAIEVEAMKSTGQVGTDHTGSASS